MVIYKDVLKPINFKNLIYNKQLKKTLLVTLILCFFIIVTIYYVQKSGQNSIKVTCSYLDPAIIDYLAFLGALFLIIEGLIRIIQHPDTLLIRQLTRILRIVLGCSITTIHILQVMHK